MGNAITPSPEIGTIAQDHAKEQPSNTGERVRATPWVNVGFAKR